MYKRQILHYFDYLWSTHGGSLMDEGAMLQDLPLSLRVQLTMAMHKKIFTDVPLVSPTHLHLPTCPFPPPPPASPLAGAALPSHRRAHRLPDGPVDAADDRAAR